MRMPTGLLGCRAVDIGICDVSVFYTGIWNQQAIIPLYKITYGLTWHVRAEYRGGRRLQENTTSY